MTGSISDSCRPLRVCMLAYTHYEGDNRVMRYAETLTSRGEDVDVIALRTRDDEPNTTVNGVNVLKIQTRIRNERGQGAYLWRILCFLLKSCWLLLKRHSKCRYDLVHVHSVPDFLVFAVLPLRLLGTKVILDIHDILPELYTSKFGGAKKSLMFRALVWLERLSAKISDHVIIANDLWYQRITSRSVPAAKCTSVLNYPDPLIFRRTQTISTNGRFKILYPGTLNWHQGLDVAIRAFAKIAEKVPLADFYIYGGGPEKLRLAELVMKLGLENRVFLRDSVPLRQIVPIMESANLAVVPKRSDSFGNEAFSTKTLEFMSLSVPVIVADTAIDKYYFDDSVVRFFRSGDVDDLAEAMMELICNEPLRKQLSQNGSGFANQNSWTNKQKMYLEIVDKLTRTAAV